MNEAEKIELNLQHEVKKIPEPPWIEKPFEDIYNEILTRVTDIWRPEKTISDYTPHGPNHLLGVENIARRLVSHGVFEKKIIGNCEEKRYWEWPLTAFERFILSLCCWMHDLGMCEKYAREYSKDFYGNKYNSTVCRDNHELISAYAVSKEKDVFFSHKNVEELLREILENNVIGQARIDENQVAAFQEDLSNIVNICIKFHRRKRVIEECPKTRRIINDEVRPRLIASFLRIADALHIDRSRAIEKEFRLLDLSRVARMHWLKSFAISDITENVHNKSITITFNIPEEWVRPIDYSAHKKRADWRELADRFFRIIQIEVMSYNS